jgi:hypothetical protein
MRKLLIGPALTGVGYAAGSYYGASAEQLVHKSPAAAYAAIEQALDNAPQSGTTSFDGGTPMPYELKIDRTPDQRLVVSLAFDGKPGAAADIDFVPQNGGQDTLIRTRVHSDHAVLRQALAGTSKARLAYAPDWMLNLSVRPLLQKLGQQIEQGQPVGDANMGLQSQADWEASLPPDQQRQVQEWRQYDASRPMVNPDDAARKYMSGGNSAN